MLYHRNLRASGEISGILQKIPNNLKYTYIVLIHHRFVGD